MITKKPDSNLSFLYRAVLMLKTEEECERVYDDVVYNMWGFNSEFYDFDFNREDARKIRLWLLELGFML